MLRHRSWKDTEGGGHVRLHLTPDGTATISRGRWQPVVDVITASSTDPEIIRRVRVSLTTGVLDSRLLDLVPLPVPITVPTLGQYGYCPVCGGDGFHRMQCPEGKR